MNKIMPEVPIYGKASQAAKRLNKGTMPFMYKVFKGSMLNHQIGVRCSGSGSVAVLRPFTINNKSQG